MDKKQAHRKGEKAFAQHCKMVEASLAAILPLAEAYLKDAPGHPDNAILEDARGLLLEHGPITGESPQSSPGSLGRAHHFTAKEREALRWAAAESLAGIFEGDIAALERALAKLQ